MRNGVLLVALSLAGCITAEEQVAQYRAKANAEDNQKCLSYGAQPGSPAYVQCRAQLDSARTQADATVAAAPPPAVNPYPVPASDAPKLQPMYIPGPRCTSRGC
jgi:hypothetical protein